jgi:Flp pilus assembly pilin Flp
VEGRGQNLVEYCLLLVMLAMTGIASIRALAQTISEQAFNKAATGLDDASGHGHHNNGHHNGHGKGSK